MQLTTLHGCVAFLEVVALPRKRLFFSLITARLAFRVLKLAAFCSEVLILLLDFAYFCLQLVNHSFVKFRGFCNSALQHALHERGILRLKIVRRHLGMSYCTSWIQIRAHLKECLYSGVFLKARRQKLRQHGFFTWTDGRTRSLLCVTHIG